MRALGLGTYGAVLDMGTPGQVRKVFISTQEGTNERDTYVALTLAMGLGSKDRMFFPMITNEGKVSRSALMRSQKNQTVNNWLSGLAEEELFFLDMTHCGRTMLSLAKSSSVTTLRTMLCVFKDVFSGVLAMHGAGMVHLDLKLTNLMVTPENQGRVVDLGFASMGLQVLTGTIDFSFVMYEAWPLEVFFLWVAAHRTFCTPEAVRVNLEKKLRAVHVKMELMRIAELAGRDVPLVHFPDVEDHTIVAACMEASARAFADGRDALQRIDVFMLGLALADFMHRWCITHTHLMNDDMRSGVRRILDLAYDMTAVNPSSRPSMPTCLSRIVSLCDM